MKKRVGLGSACLSWRGRLASCPGLMGGGLLLVHVVLWSWGKSEGFSRLVSEGEEATMITILVLEQLSNNIIYWGNTFSVVFAI